MRKDYQICRRCIMDTSDPEIRFDQAGRCNHCLAALDRLWRQPRAAERDRSLERMVERIQRDGRGKQYDCVIGLSGGCDSTTTAWHVRKLGLRPLAVHFDNGWNSELAVDNIKKTVDKLGIDLVTHVVDWEEFRDLQICFLRASVANCEIPTDHGITATLFRMARKVGTRFILSGSNLATESIMPYAWGHYNQDLRHLKAIHRQFGQKKLRTMPLIGLGQYLWSVLAMGIRQIPFLNYVDYAKSAARQTLAEEFGWRDYGGKHYESVWTRFFQGYYLPVKFGIDKRRAHLSSQICSGEMSRAEALEEMEKPAYPPELLRQDLEFVTKKFGLSRTEFDLILKSPPRQSREYPSHYFLFHRMQRYKNMFRDLATSAG